MEEEDAFHAVARCTKAVALRHELSKVWQLPSEEAFVKSGPDWLLILLSSVPKRVDACALLMFWRAWHLRNDIIHSTGKSSVIGSVKFLQCYWDSLDMI